jgi:adenylylsulfate kinase-like enzyme
VPGLGVDFEAPEQPDLVIDGAGEDPRDASGRIVELLARRGYLEAR